MSLPSNWDPVPPCQKTVRLSPGSREYQDITLKFQHTAGSMAIASIERIQIPHLYQTYQLRKEKMDKDNGGNNERQLFHGTYPDRAVKITTEGFKSSFAGSVNGEDSDKLSFVAYKRLTPAPRVEQGRTLFVSSRNASPL